MKYIWFYVVIPVVIFVYHLIFLSFIERLSSRKYLVAFLNLVVYPVVTSVFLSASFVIFSKSSSFVNVFLSGVLFAYMALILSFAPFIAPIFHELDMQFFMIAMGCSMGSALERSSLFSGLCPLFRSRIYDVLVIFIVAVIITLIFKSVALKGLEMEESRKEVIKRISWVTSVSCAVVFIPVAYFYLVSI